MVDLRIGGEEEGEGIYRGKEAFLVRKVKNLISFLFLFSKVIIPFSKLWAMPQFGQLSQSYYLNRMYVY